GGRRLEPLRKRLFGRLDGAADVLGGRARHLGDRLAGRGIDDLHRPAVVRVDPFAADEVLVMRHGDAHGLPPEVRRRTPVSRVRRCEITTGTSVSRMTANATTFTIGNCCPWRRLSRMKIGSVVCAPAVNVVTMISSNESANASSPPATSAVERTGQTPKRKLCQPSAPRSWEASISEPGLRRRRASTLL